MRPIRPISPIRRIRPIRLIVVVLALLPIAPAWAQSRPASGPASAPAAVTVEAKCINGDIVRGTLAKADDQRVEIKADNRVRVVFRPNLVSIEPAGLPTGINSKDNANRYLAVAEYWLSQKQTALACCELEALLMCARRADGDGEKGDGQNAKQVYAAIDTLFTAAGQAVPAYLKAGGKPRVRKHPWYDWETVKASTDMGQKKGEEMKKLAPKTKVMELEHYIVYSEWDQESAAIKDLLESLYPAMCKQFEIPETEHIWAGKLYVFTFSDAKHYAAFLGQVGVDVTKTAGLCHTEGPYTSVTFNTPLQGGWSGSGAKTNFLMVMAHETTHAFMARFETDGIIPCWVNEGIAEMTAANLVRDCQATGRLKTAAKEAPKLGKAPLVSMLTDRNIPLDAVSYGAAQSLCRFLIARDGKKFVKFVELCKHGKESEEALKEVFGISHDDLITAWLRSLPPH